MQKSILLKLRTTHSPLRIIFEINFLRHLAVALLTSVMSLYLRSFVNSDAAVGVIFFIGYLSAFISNLYAAHIVEHLKKRKTLLFALVSVSVIFALFSVVKHTTLVLFLFAIYQFIFSLIVLDISLYIKHYSNYKILAETTGKLGSLGNLGWLVGPLLGSLIADKFGYQAVFLTSSAVSLVALCSFFFVRLSHEEVHFVHAHSFMKNVRTFFKNPNLRHTYINNAGLGFIYSIWDYLPLVMLGLGATIPIIGMTKTLMGITQSVFEYPIGQVADKDTGERKIFIIGYIFAALFTLLLGFAPNLHLFIIFFFIAATGTAFLEMTRDSYFFRQMGEKDVELIGVYRTSDTLPYLVGQGLAIITLSFLSVQYWFIIGGAIASVFIINAYFLKELYGKRNIKTL